ncbi:ATP-binding cassette domain-containing protein [bacterium]|nr:ATP-binding cassette domain-containing protein [bacterium]
MSRVAIRVEHVSKRYQRGTASSYLRLSERLWSSISKPFQRSTQVAKKADDFWALNDLSFEVREGEVLGVIGRNGAGKSTLLKILSRITRPTQGRISWRGRVGSLLEVGTGFHPELTGRENIFLNGAVLGMTRREIAAKLDEIVAFAEIESFIDTPVKRYSSGMYVRLAFAVAAHLEPEIMLVDEVLAVGDYAFQRKCLGKMQDVATAGRTILFVSHNLTAVTSLCSRAILIERGQIVQDDDPKAVVARFLTDGINTNWERHWASDDAPGTERVRLRHIALRPQEIAPGMPIDVGTPLDLVIDYEKQIDEGATNVSVFVTNIQGVVLFNTVSPLREGPRGNYQGVVRIPGHLLNNGLHRVRVMVTHDLSPQADVDGALIFEVHEVQRTIAAQGVWQGAVRPQLDWSLERVVS